MKEGYKRTELGEIPVDWVVVSFDEIAINSTSKYEKSAGRCIDLEHIDQNTGKLLGYDIVSNKSSVKNHFKKGDVLFGKLRPYLRKFWYAEFEGGCSTEIMVFRTKSSVDSKFVNYVVQQDSFIENAVSKSFGTKMPRASWSIVSEFKLPLPPLAEQQKIATILSTVDEKIVVIEAQITQTQELKKGLMQKLLTEGIGHTRFKDSALGRIPESWEVVPLKRIGDIVTGNTPKTSRLDYYTVDPDGYLWASPADLGKGKYVVNTSKKLTEQGFSQTRKLPKKAILITCIGSTIGKLGMAIKEMSTNQQINSIKCNEANCPDFYYYVLELNKDFIKSLAGTHAVPLLNKSEFSQITVVNPTLREQKNISDVLNSVDEKIEILESKKQHFQDLKKGLMQQLLTGKIRVLQTEPIS